jgi:hypothetical protein
VLPAAGAHRALEQRAPSGRGGRSDDGRPSTDDSVPYSWSDQYDVKLQLFGRPEPSDEVVTRGDPASRSATFLWLRDRRLVAAASMNRPREVRAARGLMEKRARVEPKLLADESVDLRRLPVPAGPSGTVPGEPGPHGGVTEPSTPGVGADTAAAKRC